MPRELRNGLQGLPTCPICQAKHKCMKGEGGVWCRKVHSAIERQWKTGTVYLHPDNPFDPPTLTDIQPATTRTVAKLAAKTVLNSVYTAVLDLLTLSDDHRKDNERRGLEPVALGYRTLDQDGRRRVEENIAAKTGLSVEQLLTVPGFGTNKNGKLYLKGYPGLLVPCRDCEGNIIALRVRSYDADIQEAQRHNQEVERHNAQFPDGDKRRKKLKAVPPRWSSLSNGNNGASISSVIHWSTSAKTIAETDKVVVLTEGERKAEVFAAAAASRNEPVAVLSIPGVGSWQAAGLIDQLKATGSPKVVVAYDADHQANKDVAAPLVRLVIALRTAGLAVDVATWSPDLGKGIDDLVLAGHSFEPPDTQFLTGDNLTGYLEGLCDRHLIDRGQVGLFRQGFDQPPAEPAASDDGDPVRRVGGMEPFPVDCLPEQVADFVEAMAPDLGVDPAALALPAIGCLAGLVGLQRSGIVQESYSAFPCFWVALVMDSGDRKSTAINAVLKPFRDLNRKRYQQHLQDHIKWQQEVSEWNDRPPGEREPKPDEPKPKTFLIGDITVAAIKEKMSEHPQGLLMAHDELVNWVAAWTRYSKGGESDEGEFLQMNDGYPMSYRRKGTGSQETYIENALLSIVGGIQPMTLSKVVTAERQQSGMVPRIILVNPPRVTKYFKVGGKTEDEQRLINRAKFNFGELVDRIGNLLRVEEPMTCRREAEDLLCMEINRREDVIKNADSVVKATLSKINGMILRYAILHAACRHVFSDPTNRFIEKADVVAATRFANWVEREQMRVHGRLVEKKGHHQFDDVVQWIAALGEKGVTPRELHLNFNKKRFPDTATAKAALEDLQATGRLELATLKTGGRDRHAYRYPRNYGTEPTEG